jgi:hypothetical protein
MRGSEAGAEREYGISMASVKVTFTLDQDTVQCLETASERLHLPKSQIVRDAVQEYHQRIGRLSDRERMSLLRAFDRLLPKIPLRPRRSAERELKELRAARRSGGRWSPVGRALSCSIHRFSLAA